MFEKVRGVERYDYPGYHKTPSCCGLDFYQDGQQTIVVMTELPGNQGTSVTNCCERIASFVVQLLSLKTDTTSFIEHYPAKPSIPETYALITFQWNNNVANSPQWQYVSNFNDFLMKGNV